MKLNRTTKRAVDMLKLISKHPDGITLDDICQILDTPKTSAYDILVTLGESGMVNVMKGQRQSYTIGLTAYRIGISYKNNLDIVNIIEPVLKQFSKEVGKTVFFGVRSDKEVVYISKFEPENPIITTATVGSKNPMYCTSLGKAILAYSDKDICAQIMREIKFIKRTERTITSQDKLIKELENVKKIGYAMDSREAEEHMQCVGAPVIGADGEVIGAISVSSFYKKDEDYDVLGRMTAKKAEELSKLLGYSIPIDKSS